MIRTVLGDLDPGDLGRTDYHEHLFQLSPLLAGDELDDEDCSRREAQSLRDAGIDAMVDATPVGLGRDPEAVARISAHTGLGVVITTGAHRIDHYGGDHWLVGMSIDQLAARFRADLVDGVPVADQPVPASTARDPNGHAIRAGMLKAGVGYWHIGAFEQRVLEAVAVAQTATGAPVTVHVEFGSATFEVLDRFAGLGVPPDRVALAHMDRNPDPGLHRELADRGAYLGYDGMARHVTAPDSALLDLIAAVAPTAQERILLGGDVARRSRYIAYGGMPGLAYLPTRFLPRLVERGGDEMVQAILVDNPRRWLSWIRPE